MTDKKYIFLDTLVLRPMADYEFDLLTRGIGKPLDASKNSLKWSEEAIDTLRTLCEETEAEIVIIDNNKRFFTIMDYENMFKTYGWEDVPIAGKAPSKKGDYFLKGYEIEEYLRYRNTMDYVILDVVDLRQYENLSICAVRIDHTKGLTPDYLEQIIKTMMY